MSLNALNIGASALYAAQRAVEVAANNVANANTPGFSRQRLQVTNAVPTNAGGAAHSAGMVGNGVVMVGVSRTRDLLADLAYRSEAAASGSAGARADVLGRAETILGSYPDGAATALNNFFTSWQALSDTPTDPAARAAVLSAGQTLAQTLNSAATQLDTIGDDTVSAMQDAVGQVNTLAGHVAELNAVIADAVTAGQTPNDLMDQRDVAIDQLVTLTGATVRPGTAGRVEVTLNNAPLVTDGQARSLQLNRGTSTYTVSFTDNAPVTVTGTLGGYARALALDVPAIKSQLNSIASALATAVNAVHAQSYTLNASQPAGAPDGGDFFTGTTADTLAVRADLRPDGIAASRGGAPHDGTAAIDMAALSTNGSPSVGSLLRGVMGQLGSSSQQAKQTAATATAGLSNAEQQRNSLDGVNENEESVDLVKWQHAYQAAAQVMNVANEMLDLIINRLGAGG